MKYMFFNVYELYLFFVIKVFKIDLLNNLYFEFILMWKFLFKILDVYDVMFECFE